jgi:hypothetical protein
MWICPYVGSLGRNLKVHAMYGSIEMAQYKNKKLNLGGTSWRNKKFKTRNKKRISETPYYSPHSLP